MSQGKDRHRIQKRYFDTCVSWHMYGVSYYELLEPNQTIADVYCQELSGLKPELIKKCSRLVTIKKLMNELPISFCCILITSPIDFHLFRALQKFSLGMKLNSKDEVQNKLSRFFTSKSESFYTN